MAKKGAGVGGLLFMISLLDHLPMLVVPDSLF